MSPGSNTISYPAFAHIGLRINPGKNLNQVTCPDRESNPGYLVSRLDVLTPTLLLHTMEYHQTLSTMLQLRFAANELDSDHVMQWHAEQSNQMVLTSLTVIQQAVKPCTYPSGFPLLSVQPDDPYTSGYDPVASNALHASWRPSRAVSTLTASSIVPDDPYTSGTGILLAFPGAAVRYIDMLTNLTVPRCIMQQSNQMYTFGCDPVQYPDDPYTLASNKFDSAKMLAVQPDDPDPAASNALHASWRPSRAVSAVQPDDPYTFGCDPVASNALHASWLPSHAVRYIDMHPAVSNLPFGCCQELLTFPCIWIGIDANKFDKLHYAVQFNQMMPTPLAVIQ
ncbi:hypothetical protein ANN_22264 [Periplaneta americana]|uniref:Uncharacterized protein n=1 Tax=Periplaneta americana TaxID=6978 RepID=A0ABQ8S8F5_PERAM|nr:hypothetical protein ANN_22264 [Periplaneta americana]